MYSILSFLRVRFSYIPYWRLSEPLELHINGWVHRLTSTSFITRYLTSHLRDVVLEGAAMDDIIIAENAVTKLYSNFSPSIFYIYIYLVFPHNHNLFTLSSSIYYIVDIISVDSIYKILKSRAVFLYHSKYFLSYDHVCSTELSSTRVKGRKYAYGHDWIQQCRLPGSRHPQTPLPVSGHGRTELVDLFAHLYGGSEYVFLR